MRRNLSAILLSDYGPKIPELLSLFFFKSLFTENQAAICIIFLGEKKKYSLKTLWPQKRQVD
jgi:hypothetical protein